MSKNPMRNVKVEKIVLNVGVGSERDKLDSAIGLLKRITDREPIKTRSKKRIPTWGVRPGLAIGTKVTLRGKKGEELLKRLLEAVDFKLSEKSIGKTGSFSFGISEYIDIPGVKYDPNIGIIGLQVSVTLKRPGYRIKDRRIAQSKIPKSHLVNEDDAKEFLKNEYNVSFK